MMYDIGPKGRHVSPIKDNMEYSPYGQLSTSGILR